MREILFRGKRTDNNQWVYGDLHQSFGEVAISWDIIIDGYENRDMELVNPDTVGQYVGVTDYHIVKIFEGDIVKIGEESDAKLGVVVYKNTMFIADYTSYYFDIHEINNFLIIGNIHDNPELLEQK